MLGQPHFCSQLENQNMLDTTSQLHKVLVQDELSHKNNTRKLAKLLTLLKTCCGCVQFT